MTVRRAMAFAVLGAAVVVSGALLLGGDGSHRLRAEFQNASGLREGSHVKVGGVTVGSVESLRVTSQDTAVATLGLDDAHVIGRDARAVIRPVNLLGEKFVDLRVGDVARPAPAGATIPRSRTATHVELDDVLAVLEPTTRARLAVLVREAGLALGGRGRDLAEMLRVLPPALDDVRALSEQAARDTRVLGRLLERSDRVVAAVEREKEGLGRFIETGAGALEATAERRAALGATLRQAPATFSQLRRTLRRLDRAGEALRPAAAGLRATAPPLTATLRALPGFTAAARPALATVRQAAPDLLRLGRQATPTVRELRPTARVLDAFSADSDELLETVDEGAADLLGLMEAWASAIQTRDAVGHMFRIDLAFSPVMTELIQSYVTGPALPASSNGPRSRQPPPRRRTERPAALAPAPRRGPGPAAGGQQPIPDVKKLLRQPAESLGNVLDGVARPDPESQDEPLLDFLLGP